MKHAGASALESLSALLDQLRDIAVLKERRPGIFYFKSAAFLHFHEDPSGLYADLRIDGDWQRQRVSASAEQAALVAVIRGVCNARRRTK